MRRVWLGFVKQPLRLAIDYRWEKAEKVTNVPLTRADER